KRGLYQDLNEPCLTVTSHLAKVSLNSRDPVLLVDTEKELYRRFTPREAARIQSFPDTFEFAGSETDAYRQIGNAIPPVMFWHISNAIANILK
ncbi:DNA cytosine methyltransferase, partial [Anaerotignum propionicum]|uniref:DNA cytosine methyltransferase n=1 Tax=Anaerotignum propionicum TaxID=28446 RepID=UPI00289D2075